MDVPITIVANDEVQARNAAKALVLIGIENVVGWTRAEANVTIPVSAPYDVQGGTLLDVRTQAEWDEGAIPSAMHIPLAFLADARNVPDGKVYVHCATGARALVGASWLRSRGYDAIPILADFEELKRAKLGGLASKLV